MFDHTCIKVSCRSPYQDSEPDAYYCPSCVAENKRIAAEIDQKLAARPRRNTMSELQVFDASPKVHGFVQVRL